MSFPLRKPKENNSPSYDSIRERYTYNLGDGNYLVLEEVEQSHGRPKDSDSVYVRGRGASNDKSALVIDDLRSRRSDISPRRTGEIESIATSGMK